jgi:transglycosylase-like protein with SLT domain
MRRIGLALLLFAWPLAAGAAPPPDPAETADCTAAIATAERSGDIPAGLLAAIAHIESGRPDLAGGTVQPWPWTINVGGAGRFFATKAEAIAATAALKEQGIASIDVGCLQVNLMHHTAAFPTLEVAFDPLVNALYAARFLRLLFSQTRDWPAAVAAYHSQTPGIGAAYQDKVLAVWTSPGSATRPPDDSPPPGSSPANWIGEGLRDRDRWSAVLDSKSAAWRPITPSAPPPRIGRVIAAVAGCAIPTATPPPPHHAPAEVAPAWKGAGGNCPSSPFSKPAALRQLLVGP